MCSVGLAKLFSIRVNSISNQNCFFHFTQSRFSKINASYILNKPHFFTENVVLILASRDFESKFNFHFGQLLFWNYKAIWKVAQHKFCFALTLVFSYQQKGSFISAKQVSKDSCPTNMQIDTFAFIDITKYFPGQDCVHNSKYLHVFKTRKCAQLQRCTYFFSGICNATNEPFPSICWIYLIRVHTKQLIAS